MGAAEAEAVVDLGERDAAAGHGGAASPGADEWGLAAALSDYVVTFQRQTGIACGVEISLPVRLGRAQETVLYRVAEALGNAARHAGARHARVSLQVDGAQVSLEVGDDGAGFALDHLVDPPGLGRFGQASMRQQVEMAGGVVRVRSRPGRGATVTATLPMVGAAPAQAGRTD